MGIVGFSARKTQDEEAERPSYVSCDGENTFSGFFERLRSFHNLFYNTLKGILQRFQTILYLSKTRKIAGPLLPLKNPAPKTSDDPSLIQTLVISEPPVFSTSSDINATRINEELQYCNNILVSSQQKCLEENDTTNSKHLDLVTISIPNFTHALEHTSSSSVEIIKKDSAVFIEENALLNPEPYAEDQNIEDVISSGTKYEVSEEEEKQGETVVIKSVVVVAEAKWIKHYSSRHNILLVGEGDFSFSASLAVAFGCASNMIATSLNSKGFLKKNYKKAQSNIVELKKRGCKVIHGIDATIIASHALLGHLTFDRIIFNFPFAGFFKDLSRDSQLRLHRRLVSLFLKNAKEMISENGEIHISHKTNEFHIEWKLVSMASSHGLRLVEEVEFNLHDYPGYNTKCGFGGDKNFDCFPSNTYKFGLKCIGN